MKLTDPVIREGPQVEVEYVAFDSLGVMSSCVKVRTPEITITIDPGASAEAASYPLPLERRNALADEYAERVRTVCRESGAIVISHYHLDHFFELRDPQMFGGKVLFAKDPDDLPSKQYEAANRLFRAIDGLPSEVVMADGRKFKFGRTVVTFSQPVPHGARGADPGTVLMTEVCRGREKVLVTSDVCGPVERETAKRIASARARDIVLDGYPTYQLGQFATDHELVQSIINTCRILAAPGLKTLVVDHHLLRDYRYPAFFKLVLDKATRSRVKFGTAAEMLGKRPLTLEGYQNYGPTRWTKWFPLEAKDARAILERAVATGKTTKDWLDDFDRFVA
jgi:hypothetical protein